MLARRCMAGRVLPGHRAGMRLRTPFRPSSNLKLTPLLTAFAAAAVCSLAAPSARAASPWAQIGVGLGAAPSWVDPGVERRLWLMAALPSVQNAMSADANTNFQRTAGPSMAGGIVLEDGLYF